MWKQAESGGVVRSDGVDKHTSRASGGANTFNPTPPIASFPLSVTVLEL